MWEYSGWVAVGDRKYQFAPCTVFTTRDAGADVGDKRWTHRRTVASLAWPILRQLVLLRYTIHCLAGTPQNNKKHFKPSQSCPSLTMAERPGSSHDTAIKPANLYSQNRANSEIGAYAQAWPSFSMASEVHVRAELDITPTDCKWS
jgi:hypothetical protein